jgi:hypothetical protein
MDSAVDPLVEPINDVPTLLLHNVADVIDDSQAVLASLPLVVLMYPLACTQVDVSFTILCVCKNKKRVAYQSGVPREVLVAGAVMEILYGQLFDSFVRGIGDVGDVIFEVGLALFAKNRLGDGVHSQLGAELADGLWALRHIFSGKLIAVLLRHEQRLQKLMQESR